MQQSLTNFAPTQTTGGEAYFRVRPDLIRRALQWLISNNPLYRDVSISEENLAAFEDVRSASIPTISITNEEAARLHPECGPCSSSGGPNTVGESSGDSRSAELSNFEEASEAFHVQESFELEANAADEQTEAEKIMEAANRAAGHTLYPTANLDCKTDLMNEYTTKSLMQNCFPTLFPDGRGGLNPLEGNEERLHEYNLAEYCAHLLKWRDRRFVIHGNFKYFCLTCTETTGRRARAEDQFALSSSSRRLDGRHYRVFARRGG
ncbi:unnamed protein product [Phytophthora lilii]|uniref:Unnamed protein product n=1 Tax=Phytophthora lilii TaxID=2077276 RepID=A0A9W6XIU3_9STRA|nr:unnamed protein product [Phytophthora lilii]